MSKSTKRTIEKEVLAKKPVVVEVVTRKPTSIETVITKVATTVVVKTVTTVTTKIIAIKPKKTRTERPKVITHAERKSVPLSRVELKRYREERERPRGAFSSIWAPDKHERFIQDGSFDACLGKVACAVDDIAAFDVAETFIQGAKAGLLN